MRTKYVTQTMTLGQPVQSIETRKVKRKKDRETAQMKMYSPKKLKAIELSKYMCQKYDMESQCCKWERNL